MFNYPVLFKITKFVNFFSAAWNADTVLCVHLSVCLFLKRVDYDKTEERSVQIFIPYHTKEHLA